MGIMLGIDFKDKNVLVVDSIKQSRDTLKTFAINLGCNRVDSSYHGPDIISKCEDINYDLIMLGYDLGEDKKNGQQILEELRVKSIIPRHCIVIMITAEISQEMVLAALEHKPTDYLTKPYTLKVLNERLERSFNKLDEMDEIYKALDKGNARIAIDLCDEKIRESSPYKLECLGIKSRQHFNLNEFDKAERIYKTYRDTLNCQWANIGLGKIALNNKKYADAAQIFISIIDQYPKYLSAYDGLAQTYKLQYNKTKAQKVLEKAVTLSPRSFNRVKEYADICFQNGNYEKSTSAYFQTYELSNNSIHRNPNNAFALAKSFVEYSDQLPMSKIRNYKNKVFKVLADTNKEYSTYEVRIQVGLFNAQIHFIVREIFDGKNALVRAESLLDKKIDEISVLGLNEIAGSLRKLNREEKAQNLLVRAAKFKETNRELLAHDDALEGLSLTESDQQKAQAALEIGINLYRSGKYATAIEKLNNALLLFPSHIGIKLNLLQVLLVAYEQFNERKLELQQAEVIIKELEDELTKPSKSLVRFEKLQTKYKSIISQSEKQKTRSNRYGF